MKPHITKMHLNKLFKCRKCGCKFLREPARENHEITCAISYEVRSYDAKEKNDAIISSPVRLMLMIVILIKRSGFVYVNMFVSLQKALFSFFIKYIMM